MCGRYTLAIEAQELADLFGAELDPALFAAVSRHYNIAPTDVEPIVRPIRDTGSEELRLQIVPARFGLVNSWAADPGAQWGSGAASRPSAPYPSGARQINARSETVHEKQAFRAAFEQRRCVVPADGFYEWLKQDGASGASSAKSKQPFWFHPTQDKLFRFAGIYETWRDPERGIHLRTFSILTTPANDVVAPIHDRMPALLSARDLRAWLTGSPEEARALLVPASPDVIAARPASHRVGNVKNDDPGLIRAEEPPGPAVLPGFADLLAPRRR